MAKVKGLVKFQGTLDDLTFYKTQHGNLVRGKGGLSKERILNDPNLIRVRENGREFGEAAKAGKLMRHAVRRLLVSGIDKSLNNRAMQLMVLVKKYDSTSARGDRKVGIGIVDPDAKAAIKGFEFNQRSELPTVLLVGYSLTAATGKIEINALVPARDIVYPVGCTHVSIRSAWAKIDFTGNTTDIEFTNVQNFLVDNTPVNVSLTPAAVPVGAGVSLYLLAVEFYQEVNGVQYVLNNGLFNSLSVIEVV